MAKSVKLQVGRQSFTVSCETGEEEMMRDAAENVARETARARARFRAADGERAATMAALLVAFQAEKAAKKKSGAEADFGAGGGKIEALSERVRAVLARTGSPQERDGT